MKKIILAVTLLISSLAYASDSLDDSLIQAPVVTLSKKDYINQFSAIGTCLQCNLSNLDLRKTVKNIKDNYLEIHLDGSNLTLTNLSAITDVDSLVLFDTDLTAATLTKVKFKYSNMSHANLSGADLTGADLTGVDLSFANLTGAKLSNTNLTGANLKNCTLTFANLSNSDLSQTDFTGAVLTNATLKYAKMDNTIFTGANINGADFSNAKNMNKTIGYTAPATK